MTHFPKRRIVSLSLLLCFLTSLPLLAEHTRRWRQSTYEEFLKGTAHGVAVRSDGRLALAPKFPSLAPPPPPNPSPLTPKALFMAALLLTARCTAALPRARNPFSSIRKQNIFG